MTALLLAALLLPARSWAQMEPVSSTQPFAAMSAAYQAALHAPDPDDRRRGGDNLAAHQLRSEGLKLDEARAAELEKRLVLHPDDVAARVRLLGFYENDPFVGDGRPRRKPHTLWLIRTMPESPLLVVPVVMPDHAWKDEARRAWEPVVSASTATAEELGNAAGSLAPFADAEAAGWLRRASELQPRRALWHDMLAAIYERDADLANIRAVRALDEYDAAAALGPGRTGDRRVDTIRLALRAGRFRRAEREARALLADLKTVDEFQRAEAIYVAEQALARLSLRDGNPRAARKHMLASCAGAEGSNEYQVNPEPSVALELERRGLKGARAEFEKACARFPSWESRYEAE